MTQRWRCRMDYSPLNELAEQATQKMMRDGFENMDDKEFQLVMAHWMNSEADKGRREVIDALEKHTTSAGNGSKMDVVKRHGPGAGGGFGVGVLVSFLRELIGG